MGRRRSARLVCGACTLLLVAGLRWLAAGDRRCAGPTANCLPSRAPLGERRLEPPPPPARAPAEAEMLVVMPPGISVRRIGDMSKVEDVGEGSYGLYATRAFKEGDTVYAYPSRPWPQAQEDARRRASIVDLVLVGEHLPDGGLRVRITPLEHGELFADGTLEISGFDMLCNHDCNANMYYDEDESRAIATRDILPGEQVTVNYNCQNWDEHSNLLVFACKDFCTGDKSACDCIVRGFRHLSKARQRSLISQGGVSAYVLSEWRKAIEAEELSSN